MEEAKNLLRSFGLTGYEVKAYITLLRLGISTAEKLSEIGNIPLPRVYDTMEELQRKGFILVSKTRPKKFKPIPPKKSLKHFINIKKGQFEKRIKDLKSDIKKVEKAFSKIQPIELSEKEWTIWSARKRRNIGEILDKQKDMAKKEILIFSGDMSWISETSHIIKGVIKRGIKIRAIVHDPQSKESLKNIETAKKLKINVKTGYDGTLRGHLVDNEVAAIAIKTSGKGLNVEVGKGLPGSDSIQNYELMIFDNPILVFALKENFEFWWKNLT